VVKVGARGQASQALAIRQLDLLWVDLGMSKAELARSRLAVAVASRGAKRGASERQ